MVGAEDCAMEPVCIAQEARGDVAVGRRFRGGRYLESLVDCVRHLVAPQRVC